MAGLAQEAPPVTSGLASSDGLTSAPESAEAERDFLQISSFLTDPPLPLRISRQTRDNFLTDKDLLRNHLSPDGVTRPLAGVFQIDSPSAACEIIWDPRACRMIGVLAKSNPDASREPVDSGNATDAKSPTPVPLRIIASGPHPLRRSTGAYGEPVYFGFRWVHGRPGFLYTIGSLIVEEWIWLEEPTLLRQHFRIRAPESDVIVILPPDWSSEVTSTAGTIKDGVLTVPAEAAAEFAISTRLSRTNVVPTP
jgi:hypothetical protein